VDYPVEALELRYLLSVGGRLTPGLTRVLFLTWRSPPASAYYLASIAILHPATLTNQYRSQDPSDFVTRPLQVKMAKIDVHAHYLPDFYADALRTNGHGRPDGMPAVPKWDVEENLAVMDKMGIGKAYVRFWVSRITNADLTIT
jgi:hypothetical protein